MLEGWARAGTHIRTARTRAGFRTIEDFARVTGIGKRTLGDLETGRRANFTDQTLDRVEAELGWAEGSIRRIVAGKRAVRHDEQLRRIQDLWPRLDAGARTVLVELAERAARPTSEV